jgi:peptidylprolyl isomerase
MKTESGLEYTEIEAGTGIQAIVGKKVIVHYTGKLINGVVFDSSYDRGDPIAFHLGKGQVILGWDEGIALMKVGGKAQLTIPPQLAYGDRGAGGVIPPNATLIFDVELVEVS